MFIKKKVEVAGEIAHQHSMSLGIVFLFQECCVVLIKMFKGELPFVEELFRKLPSQLHETFEHFVVCSSGKCDFPRKQFVNNASKRPNVNTVRKRQSENRFWRTVKTASEFFCDFCFVFGNR